MQVPKITTDGDTRTKSRDDHEHVNMAPYRIGSIRSLRRLPHPLCRSTVVAHDP
jgi:hypothetical protein